MRVEVDWLCTLCIVHAPRPPVTAASSAEWSFAPLTTTLEWFEDYTGMLL